MVPRILFNNVYLYLREVLDLAAFWLVVIPLNLIFKSIIIFFYQFFVGRSFLRFLAPFLVELFVSDSIMTLFHHHHA